MRISKVTHMFMSASEHSTITLQITSCSYYSTHVINNLKIQVTHMFMSASEHSTITLQITSCSYYSTHVINNLKIQDG
jgi:imidazoleglycerol phosphate dehydratase HisB